MGKEETVSILLDYDVDVSPADVEGRTPLNYAKQSGHQGTLYLKSFFKVIELFLRGCNTNTHNFPASLS